MLYIKNVLTIDKQMVDCSIESPFEEVIDATGLMQLPSLVDPHVRAAPPEGWKILARCALSSGATSLLPHASADCTHNEIKKQTERILQQVRSVKIPIQFRPFTSPSCEQLNTLPSLKRFITGVHLQTDSLFFSSSSRENIARLFRLCSEHNLTLAVQITPDTPDKYISSILSLTHKFQTRTYLFPIYHRNALHLLLKAKEQNLPLYAGTNTAPLLLDFIPENKRSKALKELDLRCSKQDRNVLWEALLSGLIDCIGSGHEIGRHKHKKSLQLISPCSIELTYPFLLTEGIKRGLTLQQVINITSKNAEHLFGLKPSQNFTLIDLKKNKSVSSHFFRVHGDYTPYSDLQLTGWPTYTLCEGRAFKIFQTPQTQG